MKVFYGGKGRKKCDYIIISKSKRTVLKKSDGQMLLTVLYLEYLNFQMDHSLFLHINNSWPLNYMPETAMITNAAMIHTVTFKFSFSLCAVGGYKKWVFCVVVRVLFLETSKDYTRGQTYIYIYKVFCLSWKIYQKLK